MGVYTTKRTYKILACYRRNCVIVVDIGVLTKWNAREGVIMWRIWIGHILQDVNKGLQAEVINLCNERRVTYVGFMVLDSSNNNSFAIESGLF